MTSARISRVWGTILLTITIFSLSLPAHAKYSGGTGEPNDPYRIATAEDLMLLGETPEDYDKHFILINDIDLDPNLPDGRIFDKAIIAPAGYIAFTGVFDGNGHTVSHLTIEGRNYLGLFGCLASGAEIKDLGVVDVNITGSGHVGAIAGCCGLSDRVMTLQNATIVRCHSTGAVSGSAVGGLVGANTGGSVIQSYSTATVNGSTYASGGLIGMNWGTVSACYATGAVSDGYQVGGLVGHNMGILTHCYSVGLATGGANPYASFGGLVGSHGGPGLFGAGVANKCFWNTETSGQAMSDGGAGKTTAEMKTASTFFIWGTCGNEGIWTIDEGNDYPRLWWENQPGKVIQMPPLSDLISGGGTDNDPFLIFTPEELNMVGLYLCEYDKHFKLMADVDLSGFDGVDGRPAFNVIGASYTSPFNGVFDGNGHQIRHLTVTVEYGVGGLFGVIEGEIKNLGVVDVNVTGLSRTGNPYGSVGVGGLVGWNNGGNVIQCYSTGIVRDTGTNYSGDGGTGGLVGYSRSGSTVMRCYSTCTVNGSAENVGGLVGTNGGNVIQCHGTGAVSGTYTVGGLVGLNGRGGEEGYYGDVIDSYSTGDVNCITGGGLVGDNYHGYVTRCYSIGRVNGTGDYPYLGGLVGAYGLADRVSVSFWDTQTSGQATSDGGIGMTTVEMQTAITFLEAGWDFVDEMANGTEDIWWILEGQDYPRLWWEESDL